MFCTIVERLKTYMTPPGMAGFSGGGPGQDLSTDLLDVSSLQRYPKSAVPIFPPGIAWPKPGSIITRAVLSLAKRKRASSTPPISPTAHLRGERAPFCIPAMFMTPPGIGLRSGGGLGPGMEFFLCLFFNR